VSAATYTSRDFNQDIAGAKRAASKGPVYITDRGRPAHVLLSVEDYERLKRAKTNLADLLYHEEAALIDFDPERRRDLPTKVDLD